LRPGYSPTLRGFSKWSSTLSEYSIINLFSCLRLNIYLELPFHTGDIARSFSISGQFFGYIVDVFLGRVSQGSGDGTMSDLVRSPIASSTWDGSSEPEVQASPTMRRCPACQVRMIDSPSMKLITTDACREGDSQDDL
jgi:hypothetical protein